MSASPGPEVEVSAVLPAKEAPMHMQSAAISSSACTSAPPVRGRYFASHSMISVAGVIG